MSDDGGEGNGNKSTQTPDQPDQLEPKVPTSVQTLKSQVQFLLPTNGISNGNSRPVSVDLNELSRSFVLVDWGDRNTLEPITANQTPQSPLIYATFPRPSNKQKDANQIKYCVSLFGEQAKPQKEAIQMPEDRSQCLTMINGKVTAKKSLDPDELKGENCKLCSLIMFFVALAIVIYLSWCLVF